MHIDRPIVIALILFAALLLAFFLVAPEYNKFISLRGQLAEKKAEFNAQYDYYSAITKDYMEIQSRKDEVAKIDDALPSAPNLGRLVYFFQKTTADSGLVSKDLFLSKSALAGMQGGVNSITFSMDVLGDYSALGNFIASLENSSRLFEITTISFGSAATAAVAAATTAGGNAAAPQFQSQGSFTYNMQVKTQSY